MRNLPVLHWPQGQRELRTGRKRLLVVLVKTRAPEASFGLKNGNLCKQLRNKNVDRYSPGSNLPGILKPGGNSRIDPLEGNAQTLMPKDYYCREPEKELIPRPKSLRRKIMLPVIGMTGFAVAIALLGLHLTPDSNGSYTSLGLRDRTVRLVANEVREADRARQASVEMAKEWARETIADMDAVEQIGQKYIDVLSEKLRNGYGVTNQEDISDYIGIMSLHYLHYLGELLHA